MILVVSSLISLQRTIERGRLARAGRAGDEDDAVRPIDQLFEGGMRVVHMPASAR